MIWPLSRLRASWHVPHGFVLLSSFGPEGKLSQKGKNYISSVMKSHTSHPLELVKIGPLWYDIRVLVRSWSFPNIQRFKDSASVIFLKLESASAFIKPPPVIFITQGISSPYDMSRCSFTYFCSTEICIDYYCILFITTDNSIKAYHLLFLASSENPNPLNLVLNSVSFFQSSIIFHLNLYYQLTTSALGYVLQHGFLMLFQVHSWSLLFKPRAFKIIAWFLFWFFWNAESSFLGYLVKCS